MAAGVSREQSLTNALCEIMANPKGLVLTLNTDTHTWSAEKKGFFSKLFKSTVSIQISDRIITVNPAASAQTQKIQQTMESILKSSQRVYEFELGDSGYLEEDLPLETTTLPQAAAATTSLTSANSPTLPVAFQPAFGFSGSLEDSFTETTSIPKSPAFLAQEAFIKAEKELDKLFEGFNYKKTELSAIDPYRIEKSLSRIKAIINDKDLPKKEKIERLNFEKRELHNLLQLLNAFTEGYNLKSKRAQLETKLKAYETSLQEYKDSEGFSLERAHKEARFSEKISFIRSLSHLSESDRFQDLKSNIEATLRAVIAKLADLQT